MLLNYFKLAIRLLLRNPFFTIINMAGLAIGFASFFALWQYASSELKVDQFYKDADRIARIGMNWRWTEDGGENWGLMVFGISKSKLPPIIIEDFPEVETFVRVLGSGGFFQTEMVRHDAKTIIAANNEDETDRRFKEDRIAYVDTNFFDFFDVPLFQGEKDKVLREPNLVTLSKSTAVRYFGDKNPIGELLTFNDTITLQVSGVYKDFPHNTHQTYDMLISNKGLVEAWDNAWLSFTRSYVKVRPGTSLKDLEAKLIAQTEKYFGENTYVMKTNKFDLFVQPLNEIAFSKSFTGDDFPVRSKTILLALVVVSIVVLLMAWVNYVNLTYSRVTKRYKEFATRKANGAGTVDLTKQFLVESLVTNLLAIAVAFTLLQVVRQPLKINFNIQVTDWLDMRTETSVTFALIILTGILITGLYPAFLGMNYNPQSLFRMNAGPVSKRTFPSVLTTVQFASAMALILWGSIVYLQLNHILNKETGLSREGVIVVDAPVLRPKQYHQQIEAFHNDIINSSYISKATTSLRTVGDFAQGGAGMRKIGGEDEFGLDGNGVDETFIPFYEMKILAGRNFVPSDRKDAVIISRVAANRMGFKNLEDAVGTRLDAKLDGMEDRTTVEVIGVMNDYRIEPYFSTDDSHSQYANGGEGRGIFFTYRDRLSEYFFPEKISIKLNTDDYKKAIAAIETSFRKFFPGDIFTWYFLDDHVNKAYGNERIIRNQILLFTILAIVIASLGLVGMMANRINEKTKEIGIRKVLGAGSVHLAKILLQTTMLQFILSILIGIPLARYLGTQYLEKYSERISLAWWYFLIPVALLLIIMIASVSTLLWKAVRTNPVESLRSE